MGISQIETFREFSEKISETVADWLGIFSPATEDLRGPHWMRPTNEGLVRQRCGPDKLSDRVPTRGLERSIRGFFEVTPST